MSHAHNGPQVTADAIVGRIIYQYSDGIGMFRNSPCHLLALHAQRNPQPRIDFRIDINRNGTAEYQGIDDTFMDIAWQDNLIPRLQTVSTMLCTALVVPPTMRNA